jgi:predicted dithiol-disulfide oxidoreductase (DUF899 family)
MTEQITEHTIGTREEWLAAPEQLLVREKAHTRVGDELAQQRRELPWVRVEKEYRFDTDDGEKPLVELFVRSRSASRRSIPSGVSPPASRDSAR